MHKKSSSSWINLVINVLMPTLVLTKGHSWFDWSPITALLVACCLPIAYGLYELMIKRHYNALSIIALVSILLTGVIGLLELPTYWLPFKEAAIPGIIGLAILLTHNTRFGIMPLLVYNDNILNLSLIQESIKLHANTHRLQQLLKRSNNYLAISFFISSGLNFWLAKYIVKSPSGTQAFTEELGKLTGWSYPVIALPCMLITLGIFWNLFRGLQSLTGMKQEQLLNTHAH